MNKQDDLGLPLSGATAHAHDHYRRALRQFQCYIEDPVASVDAAIAASPGFVMAHVLKGYLHLLGTEPDALPVARDCHAAARGISHCTARERGHIEAIGHLIEGRWHQAGRVLEDVAIDHPRDVLALQAGHLIDFYVGNSRLLRDRITRALPAWSQGMPGHHAVLGMLAFGLEETGDYAGAERQGRRGVELEPRDGWAQHAVAHVMEMQCRTQDGIAWMRDNADAWSRDSFFQVHNWWHLALFHLELGNFDEVLKLFDGPIHGARSTMILDMIDASAMLWRLSLRGIDVAERWQSVADGWMPYAEASNYAFNDAHAMMAFMSAGRSAAADALIHGQQVAMQRKDDNAVFTREVGHPLALGIRAFAERRYDESLHLIRPLREIAHRFGGSHAQRDLIDLTLIEAALRAGRSSLAAALCAERDWRRPHSPFTRRLVERSLELPAAA